MKFNEKLMSIRKTKGLSQEELGMELQVSRQTISKWESGQSYPDFQRLVMLSDYFDMTLDELVKDIDVQDVRDKNLTDEKVASIYLDVENVKKLGVSIFSRKLIEDSKEGFVRHSSNRVARAILYWFKKEHKNVKPSIFNHKEAVAESSK